MRLQEVDVSVDGSNLLWPLWVRNENTRLSGEVTQGAGGWTANQKVVGSNLIRVTVMDSISFKINTPGQENFLFFNLWGHVYENMLDIYNLCYLLFSFKVCVAVCVCVSERMVNDSVWVLLHWPRKHLQILCCQVTMEPCDNMIRKKDLAFSHGHKLDQALLHFLHTVFAWWDKNLLPTQVPPLLSFWAVKWFKMHPSQWLGHLKMKRFLWMQSKKVSSQPVGKSFSQRFG